MSFARMSPTPSTDSSSGSEAARISSSPRELAHDRLNHHLGNARDAPQDAVAAWRGGMVEGVQLAVVAEQLGQPTEVEQVLMRQPGERVQHHREPLLRGLDDVVAHQRRLVGGDPDHRLLELHLDQAPLGAQLDDVALDLHGHARDELGALEHGQHVVQGHPALELERGQPRRDLVEAAAVLVERRQRLVGLGEHDGDVLEDVLRAVEVERDDAPGWPRWRSRARRSASRRARPCGGGCRSPATGSWGPASAARSPTGSWCRWRRARSPRPSSPAGRASPACSRRRA